ncbi:MAG: gliding motility lipoprotein GldK [Candidatus Amoebophilus sp. 36-38]|nr:MAG: gliding motility lipoprotein GldK [Candidatus Amoebophilus sp. 36-38]
MESVKKNLVFSYRYLSLFLFLFLIVTMHGCTLFGAAHDDHGELKAVRSGSWKAMEALIGMVLVPGGPFMMGEVDGDIVNQLRPNRSVTVSPFFMDDTEITNIVYRNFIEKVSDRFEELQNEAAEGNAELDEEGNPRKRDKVEEMLTEEFIEKLKPDKDVWHKDFENTMADIILTDYHESSAFDDFPVVGVSWESARYFADWRTMYLNENREQKGLPPYPRFSLPSAAQWEYAARGGKELAKYPWGGPYVRDHEGSLRANFKSGKGSYSEKISEIGYAYTSPVTHFAPNDYGLYDMAGNVAEWTLDAYNPAAISKTWDLDPIYLNDTQPMKIIKGGSWKDISRFLQTGAIDYEHKDSTRSYIGFRCVIPYIGPQDSAR